MATHFEMQKNTENTSKFVNFAKFPYIKIFKFLSLEEQLVMVNLSRNVRSRILSFSKLLNLYIKTNKNFSYKIGADFNLEDSKKLVSLFECDFKNFSNFVDENKEFSKIISQDKMIVVQAFIVIKIIKDLYFSKNKMIYNKEVLKINQLDESTLLSFKKFKLKKYGPEVIFKMFSLISKINIKNFNIDGLDFSQNKLEQLNFFKNSDSCMKLKHLNFSSNKISKFSDITHLVNFCPNIEYFDLSNNLIQDEGVEDFIRKIFNSKINTLILDGNKLTNYSGNKLFELFCNYKNIKCLKVKHNPMDCLFNNFFSIRENNLTDFLDLSSSEEINSKLGQIYNEIIETNLHKRLVGIKISSYELSETSRNIYYKFLNFPQFLFLTFDHAPLDLLTLQFKIFVDIILNTKRSRLVDFSKLDFTLSKKQTEILCNFLNNNQDVIPYIYEDNLMTLYEYPPYIKDNIKSQKSFEYLNLREFNHDKVCESTLVNHSHYVTSLMQNIEGKLVSASWDKTIKIWDISTISNKNIECISTIYTNVENMSDFLFLPDNKILVKTYEGVVKIIEQIPKNVQEEKNSDYNCTLSLDKFGQQGLSYCLSNEKKIISGMWYEKNSPATNPLETLKNYFTFIRNYKEVPSSILLLPDAQVAIASNEKSINILDSFNNYSIVDTLIGHKHSVLCLILLPDGKIVSGSKDKKIKIWNKNSNNKYECIATLKEHKSCVTSLLILPDGNFASGSRDSKIIIWRYDNNKNKYKCVNTFSDHEGPINSLILLNDGRIASSSEDCHIKIWK